MYYIGLSLRLISIIQYIPSVANLVPIIISRYIERNDPYFFLISSGILKDFFLKSRLAKNVQVKMHAAPMKIIENRGCNQPLCFIAFLSGRKHH